MSALRRTEQSETNRSVLFNLSKHDYSKYGQSKQGKSKIIKHARDVPTTVRHREQPCSLCLRP